MMDEVIPAFSAEFHENIVQMYFYRSFFQSQFMRNFFIRKTTSDQKRDLALPIGQQPRPPIVVRYVD